MANPSLSEIATAIEVAEPPAGMQTKLVAIDGCGGSGKSTFAATLSEHLDAPVIHTDDFASWDNALDWDARFQSQVLTPFKRNTPAHYQRYDWGSRTLAEWHHVPVGGIVIIEGVSATRAAFRPTLAFKIFVETPPDICLQRGLARDGQDALPLWEGWQREEAAYLAREDPTAHADLIIDGTLPLHIFASSGESKPT